MNKDTVFCRVSDHIHIYQACSEHTSGPEGFKCFSSYLLFPKELRQNLGLLIWSAWDSSAWVPPLHFWPRGRHAGQTWSVELSVGRAVAAMAPGPPGTGTILPPHRSRTAGVQGCREESSEFQVPNRSQDRNFGIEYLELNPISLYATKYHVNRHITGVFSTYTQFQILLHPVVKNNCPSPTLIENKMVAEEDPPTFWLYNLVSRVVVHGVGAVGRGKVPRPLHPREA